MSGLPRLPCLDSFLPNSDSYQPCHAVSSESCMRFFVMVSVCFLGGHPSSVGGSSYSFPPSLVGGLHPSVVAPPPPPYALNMLVVTLFSPCWPRQFHPRRYVRFRHLLPHHRCCRFDPLGTGDCGALEECGGVMGMDGKVVRADGSVLLRGVVHARVDFTTQGLLQRDSQRLRFDVCWCVFNAEGDE